MIDASTRPTLDLAGWWTCRLDEGDRGLAEHWWRDEMRWSRALYAHAELPGTTETNQIGRPPDGRTLRCLNRRHPYAGAAWWQRAVDIPSDWQGRRVELVLERVQRQARVFAGNCDAGSRDVLSAPQVFRLDAAIDAEAAWGQRIPLTIRTDNRVAWSSMDSATADDAQTNWNGIVGQIYLRALSDVHIRRVAVFPGSDPHRVSVEVHIFNGIRAPDPAGRADADLTVTVVGHAAVRQRLRLDGTPLQVVTCELDFGADVPLWDEFSPHLLDVVADLEVGGQVDRFAQRTGVRRLATHGTAWTINGRPWFLRGTVDGGLWPDTGYAPMDEDSWRRKLQVCRDHGLNHLRFHSWCPSEAGFRVADEMGFYLQVEGPFWTTLGMYQDLDRLAFDETRAIVEAYGHHPSFCLMGYGNEPNGVDSVHLLHRWVTEMRRLDPRRLYTGATGWPLLESADYINVMNNRACGNYVGDDGVRLHCWDQQLRGRFHERDYGTRIDFSAQRAVLTKPVVAHETGQWVAYPDFGEAEEYTGVLTADDLGIVRDRAAQRALLDSAEAFHLASGRLQELCYKAEVEAALATRDMNGFQLLSLADYHGEGLSLVGPVTPHWRCRRYDRPATWREFCAPTVPLARFDRHVWTAGETIDVDLEAAHFGLSEHPAALVRWALARDETVLAQGEIGPVDLRWGTGQRLGTCTIPVTPSMCGACRLAVELVSGTGDRLGINGWPLWVVPEPGANPTGVECAEQWTPELAARVERGGRVLLTPDPALLPPEHAVVASFAPMFWSSYWTNDSLPRTLGLLVRPGHPALAGFPTGTWSDWLWHDVVTGGRALVLDDMPTAVPPVEVIDDFFRAHRLGLVVPCRVGEGRVIVCGCDLRGDLAHRPSARHLRACLLAALAAPGPWGGIEGLPRAFR